MLTMCETRGLGMDVMLRGLPAQQREIIVATYFRGRSTGEAARLLGITPAEVKARIYQAMLELSDIAHADR
jgi:DNA-directed RNA polymerase specialized sigma24 family protein